MTHKMATADSGVWPTIIVWFSFFNIPSSSIQAVRTFDIDHKNNTFDIDYQNNTFLKDGKPFRYISGSMHYSRTHPYYWEDRLLKLRSAGLNAVQTYVPWNVHETTPGLYNWQGFSDLGLFLTLAHKQDLLVLLRLGPYICGEWEFGGFPAWLLSEDPEMVLRTSDTAYFKWVDKWYTALLSYIKPYLYSNGGPVIMVQIENEYGSYFACDNTYMTNLLDKVKSILGNVVLYTTDGCGLRYIYCGKVDGAYPTVDFGSSDDPTSCFAAQKFFQPLGPMVNSEYYTGWLDHWGAPHSKGDTTVISKVLDKLLASGANINMYMFVGGTNFGFMNVFKKSQASKTLGGYCLRTVYRNFQGCVKSSRSIFSNKHVHDLFCRYLNGKDYHSANSPPYQPVPTSYDYDSPISEAGDITPKYLAIRDIISKYLVLPHRPIPPNTNKSSYGEVTMEFACTIQDALPFLTPDGPLRFVYPVPMEQIKFYSGFILYRSVLTTDYHTLTVLHSAGIRDRAIVMVNTVPFGRLDRDTTAVKITGMMGQYVDILVENQGRVGFGTGMNFNNKGIIGNVTLGGQVMANWLIYRLNLENINGSTAQTITPRGNKPIKSADGSLMTPAIYVGSLFIPDTPDQPQDTFLDPQQWGKGQAVVNDFNIGRYWPGKGPQVTLYIPKPVLKKGHDVNLLYLLELEQAPCQDDSTCHVTLTDLPDLDGPITQVTG